MRTDDRIVIGTSIAPFNVELQKECISSWVRYGFKVFSFNCKSEIEFLEDKFADVDVEFIEVKRNAKEFCGKELPFIQDILNDVSALSSNICGYFNSDIYFDNITENLYKYICDEAKNALIVVHRNEINSLDDIKAMNWNINLDGIDGFFVDKKRTKNLYGDWAFVQTVWDTFLLIMCKNKGIPVKTLLNPIAFHKRHKVRWDYERTQKTYNAVISDYYDGNQNGRRDIFYDKYNYLYEYSKNIVYCEYVDYKSLFVVDVLDEEQVTSINSQKLENYKIVTNKDENIQEYDFVFKIKKGIVLDPVFCRFAFYLFETYAVKDIKIGCFFISEVERRMIFNQLNKNITQLTDINRQCNLFSCAISNKVKSPNSKTVLYPICYEEIDIFNQSIVDRVKILGPTYIMPAGYRSGEWYAVHRCNLGEMNIVGCLDNDQSKVGKLLLDKEIYDAKEILEKNEKYNLILCTKYYQEEIREQLTSNQFASLVDADRVLWVDETGELYVLNFENYKAY